MKKVAFFSLPARSVVNTLDPLLRELAIEGCEVLYFNTPAYNEGRQENFRFIDYSPFKDGYDVASFQDGTSYFRMAQMLANTMESVLDHVVDLLRIEAPDVIIHSHLAPWGKLVASILDLPGVCLYSTFVLAPDLMLPFLRKKTSGGTDFSNILLAHKTNKKIAQCYDRYDVIPVPDIWQMYVNSEPLNISFILPPFQPHHELLEDPCFHVGYPTEMYEDLTDRKLIYVSLGTVFNKEVDQMKAILGALSSVTSEVVISAGASKGPLDEINDNPNIRIETFTDQVDVLRRSRLFISHGGMASVQEAVYHLTPLIVIPKIPEQELTAERVEQLGIGVHLPEQALTSARLAKTIVTVLASYDQHILRLQELLKAGVDVAPHRQGVQLIKEHVQETANS